MDNFSSRKSAGDEPGFPVLWLFSSRQTEAGLSDVSNDVECSWNLH